ncbi:hypothetical protein [Paractinoplanes rishiriensis]|uniref:Uncharacterized protein n=1 Tax=Paractinoplanes rishiriensis TaxID=1050105 RepID=A0A919K6M8_9ACTN|nr:hypothetical protein [Actinoplanes rishiriensis]GIF01911.1 hypothetical protein Ari01nite_93750 [Actinoplanes rishiriensis]
MKRLVFAVLVLVVAVAGILHVRREREWAHGGAGIDVSVDAVVATAQTFDDTVVRFGVPPGEAVRYVGAAQSLVVRVRWSGVQPAGGWFQVMVLDKRVNPGRLLTVDSSWSSEGASGGNWAGTYEILAERYDWLGGVAEELYVDADGWNHQPTAAASAPATESGTMTAWYRQIRRGQHPRHGEPQPPDDTIPITDPAKDTLVAMVFVDEEGEVRWARRIFG